MCIRILWIRIHVSVETIAQLVDFFSRKVVFPVLKGGVSCTNRIHASSLHHACIMYYPHVSNPYPNRIRIRDHPLVLTRWALVCVFSIRHSCSLAGHLSVFCFYSSSSSTRHHACIGHVSDCIRPVSDCIQLFSIVSSPYPDPRCPLVLTRWALVFSDCIHFVSTPIQARCRADTNPYFRTRTTKTTCPIQS